MKNSTVSYYSFGQRADRLIQVEVRADGSIRAQLRARTGNSWLTAPNKDSGYATAMKPGEPITFTASVNPKTSWGLVSVESPVWDPEYPDPWIHLLGLPNPAASLSPPFGADVDWGTGTRDPNGTGLHFLKCSLSQAGVLTIEDAGTRKCRTFVIDVNKCFDGGSRPARVLVVLRVAGENHGGVTFTNVTNADKFKGFEI